MPIIAIKNLKDTYVNGEKFTISYIDNDKIKAISEITNNEIIIESSKFQRNFYVAYCITSHKAQGSTFTKPYTIHEWDRLNKRCKYVSLTRSNTWDNCNIAL
jgi:ATP-dependent exoDNAse (exonuclease V) alpha subunit